MSIPAAYIGVILIWSTTPLAIKWSGEGPGWLFGVSARMALGAVACLALVVLLRQRLPFDRGARRTYLAVGLGIFGGMLSVYWAAQFIPSGWISVLFGLNPMVTAVLAAFWLGERSLTPVKLAGMAAGLAGLAIIFARGATAGPGAVWGIAVVCLAVLAHATSAVWVKRLGSGVPALAQTAGGVSVAALLFVLVALVSGQAWPSVLPQRALLSIAYLALMGSVVGFLCYYYVLKHVEAAKVALVTLITPVLALFLGAGLNGEPVGLEVLTGTGLILAGLALHQWGGLAARRSRRLLRQAEARMIEENGTAVKETDRLS